MIFLKHLLLGKLRCKIHNKNNFIKPLDSNSLLVVQPRFGNLYSTSVSMTMPSIDILCRWSHRIFMSGLFTQHNVFQVHTFCSMYQNFI